MYIGLYTEPIISDTKYKGLYRLNIPSEYWSEKKYGSLYDMSNWYINNSVDGFYFEFSDEIFEKLLKLQQKLHENKCNADLIIFGDNIDFANAEFLGYDINGNEKYLSLIVLMVSAQYTDSLFKIIFEHFNNKLNESGLFKNEEDANELIDLYNDLLIKYRINIEKVADPKPIKIYKYKA